MLAAYCYHWGHSLTINQLRATHSRTVPSQPKSAVVPAIGDRAIADPTLMRTRLTDPGGSVNRVGNGHKYS